jgi:hypothetical protein
MDEQKMKEILESIYNAIVFSPHDWASHHRLAWIYGIICGWNDECFEEFKNEYNWDDETINKLKSYHEEIKKFNL